MAMPTTVTITAETIAITAVVCTAARIFDRSPCPMRMAIVAFVPIETPTKKLMNSATKGSEEASGDDGVGRVEQLLEDA